MKKEWDEDATQEFELALLEGCSREEAEERAIRADNIHSRRRQLWMGSRQTVLWPEFFDWSDHEPNQMFTDDRLPAEIEEGFLRRERLEPLLDLCTPRQREVLEVRYGLLDGELKTFKRTAELLGMSRPQESWNLHRAAIGRILRELAKPSEDEVAAERRRRKNEYNRKFMARKRAEARSAG